MEIKKEYILRTKEFQNTATVQTVRCNIAEHSSQL